jgi:hypothetical protein
MSILPFNSSCDSSKLRPSGRIMVTSKGLDYEDKNRVIET